MDIAIIIFTNRIILICFISVSYMKKNSIIRVKPKVNVDNYKYTNTKSIISSSLSFSYLKNRQNE